MTTRQFAVCVIGSGPRGLSVFERICANAAVRQPSSELFVHLVDPYRPGAGNTWRTDQSGELLMNTVASQVTLFTDESVELEGPLRPGPSLHEWARFLTVMGTLEEMDEHVLVEARELGPDSYPPRRFYGHYLEWVFRRTTATAPGGIHVVTHQARAVALDDTPDGGQSVRLSDGTVLSDLDAVVLAQGHTAARTTGVEAELADFAERHGAVYVPPASPADVDLSVVRPGEPVLLRGLGLNFFDHMALLTVGRGGRFATEDGRLVYRPSGREPRLYAGSRRGVPHHARGENQKGAHGRHQPRVLTPEVVAGLRDRGRRGGGTDFRREVWPLIAKEVETVYYTALVARSGAAPAPFRQRYLAAPWGSTEETRLLAEAGIGPAGRWDWQRIARPYADREFTGTADFHDWLLDHLRADVAAAREGNIDGPVKSALDVLRDLRNEIRLVVDHGGLTARSQRDDLERWYTPLNAFLSIGPPAHRTEQMAALIEAGVLTVLGPATRIATSPETGTYIGESPLVPGSRTHARVLIEARLPEPDLRRTADPLLGHLLRTGQCRPYTVGETYETGGLAVTERPYHVVDAAGRAHPGRFAFGVPTEAVHWVTAAGVRPGVNSVTLTDADAIARAVLARCSPAHRAVPDQPAGTGREAG
ncbi:FAD/NAD(P)-binding protein [Streptomyces sp. RPT161]|uniref:FAD/NAD(P)-binding protein n=1 Tax=Streptomyces sp. RPT161 TaxID=3015993 RepID=UPI0022B90541|nr:FAD/NAD(P)-binding protein [Streptomyces sp. RPT161]